MRYRDQRFPSDYELRVRHGEVVRPTQLVNISTTGARLGQLEHLPQDALVTICRLHVRVPARVVWSNDLQTGVRFVTPLSTSEVNMLRGAVRGVGSWGSSSHYGFRELG